MSEQLPWQSSDPVQNRRLQMNIMRALMRGMSSCSSIWLRVRFGSEYLPARIGQLFRLVFLTGGFGVLVLLLVVGAVTANSDPTLLILFLLASFVRYLSHRIASLIRRKRGTQDVRENERQFSGVPLLNRLLPFLSETFIKRYIEPLLVLAVGYAISHGEPLLGGWLMVSGMSLFFEEQLEKAEQDRIERQWREITAWQTQMNGERVRPRTETFTQKKRSEPMTPVPMPDAYAALTPAMRAWLERERQATSNREEEHHHTYESDLI